MLKKIAIAALISGFTVASFAQAGKPAVTPEKASAPAATEQKAETPKPAKHVKRHKKAAKKAVEAAKTDTATPATK